MIHSKDATQLVVQFIHPLLQLTPSDIVGEGALRLRVQGIVEVLFDWMKLDGPN